MKNRKKVCLVMNLGGFESRLEEHLEYARGCGETLYSMTGDGIQRVEERLIMPVNVLSLSFAELMVWSSLINEQLQDEGICIDDAVIMAAGKNYRGVLPLGTAIGQGFKIGA